MCIAQKSNSRPQTKPIGAQKKYEFVKITEYSSARNYNTQKYSNAFATKDIPKCKMPTNVPYPNLNSSKKCSILPKTLIPGVLSQYKGNSIANNCGVKTITFATNGRNETHAQLKASNTIIIPDTVVIKQLPHHSKKASVSQDAYKGTEVPNKLYNNSENNPKFTHTNQERKEKCPSTQDSTGIRNDISKSQNRGQDASSQRDFTDNKVINQSDTDEKLNNEEIKSKIKHNLTSSHINCKSNPPKKNLSAQCNMISTQNSIDYQQAPNMSTQENEFSKVKNLMGQLKSITTGEPIKENRSIPKNKVTALIKPCSSAIYKSTYNYSIVEPGKKFIEASDKSSANRVVKGIYEDELIALKEKLVAAFGCLRTQCEKSSACLKTSMKSFS